jgi:hypothetical protein
VEHRAPAAEPWWQDERPAAIRVPRLRLRWYALITKSSEKPDPISVRPNSNKTSVQRADLKIAISCPKRSYDSMPQALNAASPAPRASAARNHCGQLRSPARRLPPKHSTAKSAKIDSPSRCGPQAASRRLRPQLRSPLAVVIAHRSRRLSDCL